MQELRPLIHRRQVVNNEGKPVRLGAIYPKTTPLQTHTMDGELIEHAIVTSNRYMTNLLDTTRSNLQSR